MSVKAASVGHFQIPTAPAALTAVAQSATANTLGSAVSFGNSPSALYITGVTIGVATTQVPTYVQIQILVAAAIVASVLVPYGVSSGVAASVLTGYRPIYPPIPVANAAAITVKSASSVASAVAWGVSLECIAQANVVDDGIAVGTVTTVTNQLTAATIATGVWQDATAGDFTTASSIGKSLYTTGAVPGAAGGLFIAGSNAATTANITGNLTGNVTGSVGSVTGAVGSVTGAVGSVTGAVGSVTGNVGGNVVGSVASVTARVTANTDQLAGQTVTAAAGVTFPTSVASPTNITAGTITTATNLTNSPTAGDFTAVMKTSLNASTPVVTATVIDKTGFALTAAYDPAKTAAQAGNAMTLTAAYDAAKTAAPASDVTAIKAKTDSLTYTVAGKVDANGTHLNGTALTGNGGAVPWGPV